MCNHWTGGKREEKKKGKRRNRAVVAESVLSLLSGTRKMCSWADTQNQVRVKRATKNTRSDARHSIPEMGKVLTLCRCLHRQRKYTSPCIAFENQRLGFNEGVAWVAYLLLGSGPGGGAAVSGAEMPSVCMVRGEC